MKRTLLPVVLALVSLAAATAQAGWHHRHQQYAYAYPAYAYYPAYAPTQVVQAQSGLGEMLLLELIRKLPLNPTSPGPGPGPSDSSIRTDLADIKASLKHLDARVENLNSTVQVHGEAFGSIMAELKEIRSSRMTESELLKTINDNQVIRENFDHLLHGTTPEEKAESRAGAIKAIFELMMKK